MPAKKPSGSNPAPNYDGAESEAENVTRVLYNIVEDEERPSADTSSGEPQHNNAVRQASASRAQPQPAPPPAQPTPPAVGVAGGNNGGLGKLVLKSVISGVVMGVIGAVIGHEPDIDIFN